MPSFIVISYGLISYSELHPLTSPYTQRKPWDGKTLHLKVYDAQFHTLLIVGHIFFTTNSCEANLSNLHRCISGSYYSSPSPSLFLQPYQTQDRDKLAASHTRICL